jgi:hypothetical protein
MEMLLGTKRLLQNRIQNHDYFKQRKYAFVVELIFGALLVKEGKSGALIGRN